MTEQNNNTIIATAVATPSQEAVQEMARIECTKLSSTVCRCGEYSNYISNRNSSVKKAVGFGIGSIAVIAGGVICVGHASFVLTHDCGFCESSYDKFMQNKNIIRGIGCLISLIGTASVFGARYLYKKAKHHTNQAHISNDNAMKILLHPY